MSFRFDIERVVLGVVALGMAAFFAAHSFVLLKGSDEQTMTLVRSTWLLGLVVLLLVGGFLTAARRNAA
ncbi:hypothetical protein [Halorussus ruber]|uniref:hypothetical protein n=1 Tax=Halorussus ruber TaxID=1126238 RepID=UPI001091A776|nr:hypothetical protein [Halorussus ruber]